jgi:DNA-directed RNA polymerase specialized sigma24 family protein
MSMRARETEVSFEDFVRARPGSLLRTASLLSGQRRAEAEGLLQIALERAYRHWPRICGSEGVRNPLGHGFEEMSARDAFVALCMADFISRGLLP